LCNEQISMIRILTLFIFSTLLATSVSAQNGTKNNKVRKYKSTAPIFDALNYHRNEFNEDSSLYYVDRLVEFQLKNGGTGGAVSAYFQKINTLILFDKQSEAFKLALTVQEKYCGEKRKEESCGSCGYIYEKLADFMITMQDYKQGIRYLDMNCDDKRNFHYKKATIYCFLDMPDSALTETSNLIGIAYKNGSFWDLLDAYNSHGLISKRLGKIDEAIKAFERALDFVDSLGHDDTRHAYIMGNLGSCYTEKGKINEAYECFLIDSKGSLLENQIGSYLLAELSLAEIDVKRKDYGNATKRLTSLLTNYDNHLIDDQKLRANELLMQVFKSSGNARMHDLYTSKWIELSKTILQNKLETHQGLVEQYSANSLRQVKQQMETEKELSAQELLVLQKDQEKKKLRDWLVIVALILIIITFLFFILRWRSIAKMKETELKLSHKEQDFLELKVENESKNVQALALELSLKKDFSKSLVDKLNDIESVSKTDVKNIELYIQNELDIKSTRADLQNQMGDLSSTFHSQLNIIHPHLTELDLKLAAMVVMNMSNKDIAISKNITPGSVRIAKNRLKKKLNLPEETDLTTHLKGFL